MDQTHKQAMNAHEEMMEAHKDLSKEDAEKLHKIIGQIHHPHGTDCGHKEHEAFVKKIDGMDEKLDKILAKLE